MVRTTLLALLLSGCSCLLAGPAVRGRSAVAAVRRTAPPAVFFSGVPGGQPVGVRRTAPPVVFFSGVPGGRPVGFVEKLLEVDAEQKRTAAERAASFLAQVGENLKQIADQRVGRASHIMLRVSDDALAKLSVWKKEIEVSTDVVAAFYERARLSSVCRSASKGGDLGFVTRGKLSKEFDDVIFEQEPGYIYGPLKTQFGYHLVYVHSCRAM